MYFPGNFTVACFYFGCVSVGWGNDSKRLISACRSFSVFKREICKSLRPVKILSFSWSSQDFMFSMKSAGKRLTIFSKWANLDSEILSSLRAFAQVILVGPPLMNVLIFRASTMVFWQTRGFRMGIGGKGSIKLSKILLLRRMSIFTTNWITWGWVLRLASASGSLK